MGGDLIASDFLIILLTAGCWILTLRVNGLADRVKALEEAAKAKAA